MAALLFPLPAFAEPCHPVKPHSRTEAEEFYFRANFAEAEKAFRQDLVAKPSDPGLIAFLVGALLRQQKVSDAAATVQSALASASQSPVLLTSLAEVQYRQGLLVESDQTSVAASNADLCYPRAHLLRARIARLNSMYAMERSEIRIAHVLDPFDPEIHSAWIGTLPLSQRIEELKKYLSDPTGDGEHEREGMKSYLEVLERRKAEPQRNCRLVSSTTATEIPFESIVRDTRSPQAWALMVRFNDQAAKLAVDTGAGGLYISRSIAEKAGLQPLDRYKAGGIGDKGPRNSYTAYADSIRIGQLEFQNCLVGVSDRSHILDSDGLIGMDVFSNFLVTLDFPLHKLQLAPLPQRPDERVTPSLLRTDSSDQDSPNETAESENKSTAQSGAAAARMPPINNGPKDRYVAPEMKNWTSIFRIGHDLIIPTRLSNKITKLFIIDTGTQETIVSRDAASEVTRVHDSTMTMTGISGEVRHVYSGENIAINFANVTQPYSNFLVLDLSRLSSSNGVEISGLIGSSALGQLTLHIDYRDSLVKFEYDAKRGLNLERRLKFPQ